MQGDYEFAVEIILLGQAAVGKTNLITRYVKKEFNDALNPTIGNDYFKNLQRIQGMNLLIKFWDTAGQERFATLSNMILKNINAAIFVYDITKRDSFDKIPMWLEFVKNGSGKSLKFMLIGNKSDLEKEKEVSAEEAKQFAEAHDMLFFETSAKTNKDNCVDIAMLALIEETLKSMLVGPPKERTSMVNGELVRTMKKVQLGEQRAQQEAEVKGEKKGCC